MTGRDVARVALDIMARPFDWRGADCCAAVADVRLAVTGHDALAGWRGRYETPREAVALIRAAGGWARAVEAGLMAAGLRLRPAVPGALALIARATGGRPLLAVCLAPGVWAAKAANGALILRADVAGWS